MAISIVSPYKKVARGLVGYLVGFYLIDDFILQQIPNILVYNIISIFLWGMLLVAGYGYLPRVHGQNKQSTDGTVYWWSFNIGLSFVLMNGLAGFVFGVAKSPYAHDLTGILVNSLLVGTNLLGREYIRTYLVKVYCKKSKGWQWWGIILLMVMTQINLSIFSGVQDVGVLFRIMMKTVVPCLAQNMLAMYLVLYGGIGASSICLGLLAAFEWLSPVIPQFNWFIQGMLTIGEYFIALLIIKQAYGRLMHPLSFKEVVTDSILREMPVIVMCILILWFVVGVFPIYPKVIVTGSMRPEIQPGDVILIRKIQTQEELQQLGVGEIIAFEREGKVIAHRIRFMSSTREGTFYQTKGDANSIPDSQIVTAQDIRGKVIKTIPKIGLPSLWLRSNSMIGGGSLP